MLGVLISFLATTNPLPSNIWQRPVHLSFLVTFNQILGGDCQEQNQAKTNEKSPSRRRAGDVQQTFWLFFPFTYFRLNFLIFWLKIIIWTSFNRSPKWNILLCFLQWNIFLKIVVCLDFIIVLEWVFQILDFCTRNQFYLLL